jgi:hypothetical protein
MRELKIKYSGQSTYQVAKSWVIRVFYKTKRVIYSNCNNLYRLLGEDKVPFYEGKTYFFILE